jgi:NADP-dependent 3-hydroxy acid dehydrogenase YdfG
VSGPIQYDFNGKVVVITGDSRRLGHAMALGFARCGANLAIAGRKLESCEATTFTTGMILTVDGGASYPKRMY